MEIMKQISQFFCNSRDLQKCPHYVELLIVRWKEAQYKLEDFNSKI